MSTGEFGYGGLPGWCVDPACGYQASSSYFNVSQISRQTYIETMQPRLFEECIKKGTPTRRQPVRCLCTPHRRTLFGEGRRGVQPRLFCILCQGVWGPVLKKVGRPMPPPLVTKKRTQDLGSLVIRCKHQGG